MIQRIQSLILLVAAIISGGLSNVFTLWNATYDSQFFAYESIMKESLYLKPIGVLFILSAILSFITIFLFKNRKLQFVMNRLNILLNFLLLGFIVYNVLNISGETLVSEKGIGAFLPILSVFLLVFANRYIKKDEDLVKSVDRLR
ncbi:MAG TPA: DUF4293 family protein [Flavobacteriaceae bacterium]|nr:DUF4293 family protein [Flavobacteriaceae bacterium]